MADINIYGRLVNQTPDGQLAQAKQIHDPQFNTNQEVINQQLKQALDTLTEQEAKQLEVLPFYGIEALASGTILESGYSAGDTPPSSNFHVIYDSTSKSFALKVPDTFENGQAVTWKYYAEWPIECSSEKYPNGSYYIASLNYNNKTVYINTLTGIPYRGVNKVLVPMATGEGGGIDQETLNQLLNTDTSLQQQIDELDNVINPLRVTLSAKTSLYEYTEETVYAQLIRTVTCKGEVVLVASANIYKNGDTSNPVDSSTTANSALSTISLAVSSYGDTTFKTVVHAANKTGEASCTVSRINPIYIGFAQAGSIDDLSLSDITNVIQGTNQAKKLQKSPSGSYTVNNPTSGYHLWLCVPNNITINSVKSSGFEVPITLMKDQISAPGRNYKCYRSASSTGINSGQMSITIS